MMMVTCNDTDYLVMTLVTTEPPLRSEHLGVIILRGAARGDEGEILDTDSFGHMVIRKHHGNLGPPAHPYRHRSESMTLLGTGTKILHLFDFGLCDNVRRAGPDLVTDLFVEQLLLLLIAGEVIEKEGGGAPRGVHPSHHGVHGHDGGDIPVFTRPQEHLLENAQLTQVCLILPLFVKLVGCIIDIFPTQVEDIIRGSVNSPK